MEHRTDTWMVLAVLAILGSSLATLSAVAQAVVGTQLLVRQLVWSAVGLLVLWVGSRVHVSIYERLAPVFYGLGLVGLVAVLFLGESRGGTRGWFALGPLTVQPSELARVGTALMLAAWISRRSGNLLTLKELLSSVGLVALPVGLIALEPDLGVALTYLPLLVGALWLGGLPSKTWVLLLVVGGLAAILMWNVVLRPYQRDRVLTVLDPERDPYGAGYQVRQSKIAIGSGRLAGQGLGRGSQSLLHFLPAQHTDFVFAAWAEATGFLGSSALLIAYGLLLVRLAVVAAAAATRHGGALVTLVGCWLAFQVVVNLGMVLGWVPATGITLPLFSYGGSSLIATCASLGIVQSVWRCRLVNQ